MEKRGGEEMKGRRGEGRRIKRKGRGEASVRGEKRRESR